MPKVAAGSMSYEVAVRRGFSWGSFFGSLPDPDLIIRKLGKSKAAVFKELKTDPDIKAAIGIRKAGVKRKIWDVDRDNHLGEQTDVIVATLKNLKIGRIISEIADTPYQGYSVLEHTWDWVGKHYLPVKVEAKPIEWFSYGKENELLFHPEFGSKKAVDPDKFLNPQHEPSFQNPYGEALLSACFWPYTFKKGGYQFWIAFTEKYGLPWAIAHHPRGWGREKVQELVDALADTIQDGVVAMPEGTDASLVNVSGRGNVDAFKLLIENCESQISKIIVGHSGALNSTPGKLGSEDNALQSREDLTEADTEMCVDEVQLLVDLICDINFPKRSEFGLYDKERTNTELANRDVLLTSTGVNFTKVYFTRKHGLKEDEFEVVPINALPPATPPAGSGSFNDEGRDGREEEVYDERFRGYGQFAAGTLDAPDDQSFVDDLTDRPAEQLNFQALEIITPLLDRLKKATSFSQAMKIVKEAYPTLNSSDLTDVLKRSLFFSQLAGRLGANAEDTE